MIKKISDVNDIVFGQFSLTICFTLGASAFFNHIPDIISIGSDNQMMWVNAFFIIAFMANTEPFRYFTMMKFIGKAMPCAHFSIYSELWISIIYYGCRPFPTVIRSFDIDFRPKTAANRAIVLDWETIKRCLTVVAGFGKRMKGHDVSPVNVLAGGQGIALLWPFLFRKDSLSRQLPFVNGKRML